jgi:hypothetical protein
VLLSPEALLTPIHLEDLEVVGSVVASYIA